MDIWEKEPDLARKLRGISADDFYTGALRIALYGIIHRELPYMVIESSPYVVIISILPPSLCACPGQEKHILSFIWKLVDKYDASARGIGRKKWIKWYVPALLRYAAI